MVDKLKNKSIKKSDNSAMKSAAKAARSGITGGASNISGLRNSQSIKEPLRNTKAQTALKTAAKSAVAKNRTATPRATKDELGKIAKKSKKTFNKK